MATHIRLLTKEDGPAFQQLRLTALQSDPQVFLSTIEVEQSRHEDSFSQELDYAYHPPFFGYHGVFLDDVLVAYCQIDKSYLEKQKHLAFLYNLYVHPQYRQQHIGSQLLHHIKQQLMQHEHVEQIFLSVAACNKSGIAFYKRHEFKRCGIKPKSVKWNLSYDDEIEMVCMLPIT